MDLLALGLGGMGVAGIIGIVAIMLYFDAQSRKKSKQYVRGDYVCCEVEGRIVAPYVLQPGQPEQQHVVVEVQWRDMAGGLHREHVTVPYRNIKPGKKMERRAA